MSIALTSHGWTQLGPHSYARRYEPYDVTIGLIVGSDALLVVDSRASVAEGEELLADVRTLSDKPIRGVVNTHRHVDHTQGNAAFKGVDAIGHETLDEVAIGLSSAWSTDLGDCLVEVVHPGAAHTAGDVVVKVVPDRVAYVGDLVEESGPPAYGDDSYPLEWGAALDLVVGLCEPEATVVPGHGDAVDRDFVQEQRQTILDVANQIRAAAAAGMTIEDALAQKWPLEPSLLEHAVRRGYEQLGVPAT
ncbi:MBL fold metallo-hydrolase [Solicola gregarius]|uniref:MBL fold metallo-hydrolase n=1 Tax=Solicola gregarius TaxID=2908642 RepID=A0AA46TI59_9ACTN|nr:MBL fold metallo-hydrolase [Solicola gregarius]UYM05746.1 MBL fold metallo-hydrolase [Solicola gregarius]